MNIEQMETLDSNNYQIDLDNINIPSVISDSMSEETLNDNNDISTEINITFERDNEKLTEDVLEGEDFQSLNKGNYENQDGGKIEIVDSGDMEISEIDKDNDQSELIINSIQPKIEPPTEYNNIDSLLYISVGDLIEIVSSVNKSDTGTLFYKDNKQLEIKTSDNKRVLFNIENQQIQKVTKVYILEKSGHSNFISFYNLKLGSNLKVYSNDDNYHLKKAKIIKIIDNLVTLIIDTEKLELDLSFGLPSKGINGIYDLELINEIDNDDDIEIEFLEDIDIIMEYEIKEENVICSLEEGQTCLLSELMRLFEYHKNLDKKEEIVSKIVFNLLNNLNNSRESDESLDKPKIKQMMNSNFINSCIIPLVSIKKKKYNSEEEDNNVIKSELEKELKDLVLLDKQFRDNYYSKWGNNYDWFYKDVDANMKTFLPSETGFNTNLEEDTEMINSSNSEKIELIKGLGPINRFYNEEDDNSSNKEKNNQKKIIFPSEKISVSGFLYFPKCYLFNKRLGINKYDSLKKDILNKKRYLSELFSHYVRLGKVSILSFPEDKINFKDHYKNIIIYKCSSENISEKEYKDFLNEIIPSSIDILKLKSTKNIFSIDELLKKNNFLNSFQVSLDNNNFINTQYLYKLLTHNIEKRNLPELHHDYLEIFKSRNFSNPGESFFISNNLISENSKISFYGLYPDFDKVIDDELNRYRWLHNSFDNGELIYKNYRNNPFSMTKEQVLLQIKDLDIKIDKLKNKFNNADSPCQKLVISKVYINNYNNDDDPNIQAGDYGLLIDKRKGIVSLLKKIKINRNLVWVPEHNKIGDYKGVLKNVCLSPKCLAAEKAKSYKYHSTEKDILEHLENISNKELCNINGENLYEVDFEKIGASNKCFHNNECLSQDYHHSLLKIKQYQQLKLDYQDYLNVLKISPLLEKIEKINLDNRTSQLRIKQLDISNFQKRDKYTSDIPPIIKEIKKILRIENTYKRDRLIENIIENKLRLPFSHEDPHFFYDSQSGVKALSQHWKLKVRITSQPHNASDIINELISNYGVKKGGSDYWISKTDGDQLALIDYDSFEGYDEDGSPEKRIREVIEEETDDNLNKDVFNFNQIKLFILNNLEDIHETLELIDNSNFKMSHKTLIVDDIYFYLENNYIKRIKLEYQNKKIKTSFSQYLLHFLDENLTVLRLTLCYYGIYFQTHLPILRPPHLKICNYTLHGTPYMEFNDNEKSTFIDYFSCIIYHNRYTICSNEKVIFHRFQNMSEEDISKRVKSTYIKFGKEDFIQSLYKKWDDYLSRKNTLCSDVWQSFKPNFSQYSQKKNSSHKIISQLDHKINSKDTDFISNIKNELTKFYYSNDLKKISTIKGVRTRENKKQFCIKNQLFETDINYDIFPNKLSSVIIEQLSNKYSLESDTFGSKKLFNKSGICINTGFDKYHDKDNNNSQENISKLLAFLNYKNSSKLNLEITPFDIISNIKIFEDLSSLDILKDDSFLKKLRNDLKRLYSQWDKPESESMKDDIFHILDFEVNNMVSTSRELINNKTYHYSELQNLNKVITNIEIMFKNVYLDYNVNLYHKCIQEILRTLSIIKNRNYSSHNQIPKKWNLESDSLKIINNFIITENNYEGKILTVFSKKFNNNYNKVTIEINILIKKIKEVLSFLKKMNADTDSLKNLKNTKFNLYQKYLVYKYCFYKILLFLSEEYPQESDLEEPLSLFMYLFLNNVNNKYEQYYFTLQQIKSKREEEIEEENNQTKNRRANMSEERKQIDNFEQKMNIGFYAKSGKFDFKKGFNQ